MKRSVLLCIHWHGVGKIIQIHLSRASTGMRLGQTDKVLYRHQSVRFGNLLGKLCREHKGIALNHTFRRLVIARHPGHNVHVHGTSVGQRLLIGFCQKNAVNAWTGLSFYQHVPTDLQQISRRHFAQLFQAFSFSGPISQFCLFLCRSIRIGRNGIIAFGYRMSK